MVSYQRLAAVVGMACLVMGLVLTMACSTSPNYMTGDVGPMGEAPSAYVDITNRGLQKRVQLTEARMNDRNGMLNASAILRNNSSGTVEFEYMFHFYDANGFQLRDTKAHWIPDRILGYEEKQVLAVAPTPEATTFKVVIRKPEPITR